MDDAELVRQLRLPWFTNGCEMLQRQAADRIEALIAERDAARDAALEEAAKVAEGHASELKPKAMKYRKRGDEMGEAVFDSAISEAISIAAAILALKGKSHE